MLVRYGLLSILCLQLNANSDVQSLINDGLVTGDKDIRAATSIIKENVIKLFEPLSNDDKCNKWYSPGQSYKTFKEASKSLSGINSMNNSMNLPLVIQSSCLSHESLGNDLSNYFEVRICTHLAGLHYLSVPHYYGNEHPNLFINSLPNVVIHPNPSTIEQGLNLLKSCGCESICHEWPYGMMHKHMDKVKQIFRIALDNYWTNHTNHINYLDLSYNRKSKVTVGKGGNILYLSSQSTDHSAVTQMASLNEFKLPIIPDVAIHYRCGDNVVAHYGFTPFRIFINNIPKTVTTIYVMAESSDRNSKPDRTARCAAIFHGLHNFLMYHFPTSIVTILRGHDMYEDLARLTYAKITICSVSTYCLWPAVSNNNTVYFPITKVS